MTKKRATTETGEGADFELRQARWILDAFNRRNPPNKSIDADVYMYWKSAFLTSKARTIPGRKKEATDAAIKYFNLERRRVQQITAAVRKRVSAPISEGLKRHLVEGEIFTQISFTLNEAAQLLQKTENIKVDLSAFRGVDNLKTVVQPDSAHWAAAVFASAFVQRHKALVADQTRIKDLESKIAGLEREKVKTTGYLAVYQTGSTKRK